MGFCLSAGGALQHRCHFCHILESRGRRCLIGGYLSTDLWTLADHLLLACEESERPQKEAERQRRDFFGGSYVVVPASHLSWRRDEEASFQCWAAGGQYWNPGHVTLKSGRWCLTPMRESKGHQAGRYVGRRLQRVWDPAQWETSRMCQAGKMRHYCARDLQVGSPMELCPPKTQAKHTVIVYMPFSQEAPPQDQCQ